VVGCPAHHIYRFMRLHGFRGISQAKGALETPKKTELVQMMIENFDPRYFEILGVFI
jgi:hypothetical protein